VSEGYGRCYRGTAGAVADVAGHFIEPDRGATDFESGHMSHRSQWVPNRTSDGKPVRALLRAEQGSRRRTASAIDEVGREFIVLRRGYSDWLTATLGPESPQTQCRSVRDRR
jgi:hypothetical protein